MIIDDEAARKTADLLLQINAIKLNPENPFTWASGWKSPIYCDNRIILSYPEIRKFVSQQLAKQVLTLYGTPDLIVGVATGAIGIGLLVAEELGTPFAYVRPEAKSHGRKNQIEGHVSPGAKAVVIEDLISTGMSSLNAVSALRTSGISVAGMLAIFSYGFDVALQKFKAEGVTLNTLCDYQYLINQASETGYIASENLDTLRAWRNNPQDWNA
ncbi:orotate phosphoribosyltransferase [Robiginitalea sp.]|jgi:orotate phosphoribosyltransferase|nr:orotate phosphoribosyltransferase [Robiginitalea sp.]